MCLALRSSLLGLLLVSSAPAQAQEPTQRDLEAEIDALKLEMQKLRPKPTTEPKVPANKDPSMETDAEIIAESPSILSSVDMRIWGRVVFNMTYDNFQGRPNTDFQNYVVAEGPDEFNFNPRDSRFGIGASEEWGDWKAGAVIEIDFYGNNVGNNLIPRMRLGFVTASNESAGFSMRAGQDWTPIASQNPGTIDFGILAWGGNLWWRLPQLTFRQKLGDHVEALLSLLKHRTLDGMATEERSPWICGRMAYSGLLGGQKGLLAVNAGGRRVKIQGYDFKDWLIALEWNLPLHDLFSINGEVWTGEGIGGEFLRYGLDYNLVAGTTIGGTGGFFSIRSDVTKKLRFNIGLGIDDPDNSQTGTNSTFNRNEIAFVNGQYHFTKHFGVGIEFMNLRTQTTSNQDLTGERLTFSTWFTF